MTTAAIPEHLRLTDEERARQRQLLYPPRGHSLGAIVVKPPAESPPQAYDILANAPQEAKRGGYLIVDHGYEVTFTGPLCEAPGCGLAATVAAADGPGEPLLAVSCPVHVPGLTGRTFLLLPDGALGAEVAVVDSPVVVGGS